VYWISKTIHRMGRLSRRMAGIPGNGAARLLNSLTGGAAGPHISPQVIESAPRAPVEVLSQLGTSTSGLTEAEVAARQERHGPNLVAQEKPRSLFSHFVSALLNPLVILLSVLATVSYLTGDFRAGTVMVAMVVLGVTLRFVQEAKADASAARLKAMIKVTATVIRDGQTREVSLSQLVPGDLVRLSAGDMIPADVRLITAKDLFVSQASLTGESLPVEKFEGPDSATRPSPLELSNICYMGTSVESGSATAVVLATGPTTYFGGMAHSILMRQRVQTSFDKGINGYTWLMIRVMAVMVPLVFVVNGLTKGNWHEAFFFALAVAVGLTPEMLPMIVTVCLSKGAMAMSRKKVIVKRLNSIQNFGAMDVLCTDKTGTLTMDRIILERHCDVVRKDDDGALVMAYLNSYFQTGLKNLLDRAVLEHHEMDTTASISEYRKVDEIPFDFQRKMMSVVVLLPDGKRRLITKGAPEEIFRRCTRFDLEGEILPLAPILVQDLKDEYEALSADGFRVLALAYKDMEEQPAYSRQDESDLILRGYIAFLDPPKETARPALAALDKHGVSVKVLTGDNELVSRKICSEVGIPTAHVLLGEQVERLTDAELAPAVELATLMARLSPGHKQRIIQALQRSGHVVGFLGDGINDAPALRAADVGISVDSAVDIAKESADVILLEKSLLVLEEGVLEGRKVFANILKYIRMGASSNFGNMFSVLGASAFLPFLPMAPMQILTNNLLYDFSQVPIPTDDVDPEQIARPMPWSIGRIMRFVLFIGPISSLFDYTTFFMMLYLFGCWNPARMSLFQTGWFVESLLTQTIIIHVIRTNRIPLLGSRASWPLMATTAAIMAIGIYLPFSPLGPLLGFEPLPGLYWPLLVLTLVAYTSLTYTLKTWLLRKGWV
jgi:Mg2+-importing ATPase